MSKRYDFGNPVLELVLMMLDNRVETNKEWIEKVKGETLEIASYVSHDDVEKLCGYVENLIRARVSIEDFFTEIKRKECLSAAIEGRISADKTNGQRVVILHGSKDGWVTDKESE